MAERSAETDELVWSFGWWAAALVAAIVVFFLISRLVAGDPAAALTFSAVTFIVVGVLLVAFGPGPKASDVIADAGHAPLVHAPEAHTPVTHAPVTHTPVAHAPVAQTSVAHAPEAAAAAGWAAPAASEAPSAAAAAPRVAAPVAAKPVEATGTPDGTPISERVRDAARAAGEAARAALGDPASAAAPVASAAALKPAAMPAPAAGEGDDLKRISGIGPKLSQTLHGLGVYHFSQIAAWGPGEVAWIDTNLEDFKGRATRDDWVGQARILSAGGDTEHSQRVDRGEA
jgi:predicted flap endonuclease-1-like 5' DNA nuclease